MESSVPQEKETIAVKRSARISQKIRESKVGLYVRRAWWNNTTLEVTILFFLFALNFYLLLPFFGTYAVNTPFSGPIIPMLTKGIVFVSNIPFLYAVQIVYLSFFLLFPFTFYLLIKKLTGRKLAGIAGVLMATLPLQVFAETRIAAMFANIDGHHIASLSIIPVALYALLCFLREGKTNNFLASAAISGLIALISPFGIMTYVVFASILTFSEMLLGEGRVKFFKLVLVLVIAGGLNSFWYNPSFFFWMLTGPMGEGLRLTFGKLLPMSFFIIPITLTIGYLLFDRKPNLQPLFFSTFCTIAFGVASVVGQGIVPSSPSRYLPELGISISFIVGVLVVKLLNLSQPQFLQQILPSNSKVVFSNVLVGLVILILSLGIIFGSDLFIFSNQQVLGVFDEIEKGDIWLARDNFDGIHSVIGLAITTLTLIGMFYVSRKNRLMSRYSKL